MAEIYLMSQYARIKMLIYMFIFTFCISLRETKGKPNNKRRSLNAKITWCTCNISTTTTHKYFTVQTHGEVLKLQMVFTSLYRKLFISLLLSF